MGGSVSVEVFRWRSATPKAYIFDYSKMAGLKGGHPEAANRLNKALRQLFRFAIEY
jgi:hypothetical protein